MAIDLDSATYEEWLDFIFDHPPLPVDAILQGSMIEPWYLDERWEYSISGTTAIERLGTLFESPAGLWSRYDEGQIDQGFWFIPGPYGFMWALLDDAVPWESRKACIRAIANLTVEVFSRLTAGTAGLMWWDSVFSYTALRTNDLASDEAVLTEIAECIAAIAHQSDQAAKDVAHSGIEQLTKLRAKTSSPRVRSLIERTIGRARLPN